MIKVIIGEDCGNSPKNIFLQNLTTAFARGDSKFIMESVDDEMRWNIVGGGLIQGREDLAKTLRQMKKDEAVELRIHQVASHGKAGAVDGILLLESGKRRAFCDVYEFRNTKGTRVKEITSYVIDLE